MKEQKHISMDLTADGARVTNLSLQGNRLVLTIEAELADSRLRTNNPRDNATTVVNPPHPKPDPVFASAPAPEIPEAGEFTAKRPQSADAPSLGWADSRDALSEVFGLGSESLPPAPAPVPEPDMFVSDPHDHRHDHDHPHMHEAPAEMFEEPRPEPFRDTDAEATLPDPMSGNTPFPQDDFLPASPSAGMDADADADSGIPAMAEDSSSVGGERHGEPLPAFSFGSAPEEPAHAHEPVPALIPQPFTPPFAQPQADRMNRRIPEDAPTQFDMRPVTPPPAPAPVPQPLPPKAEEEAPKGEGTTVLIRYTCPKCKTQGMQAVDKVGTVVNCANCGKAMRLVMKK